MAGAAPLAVDVDGAALQDDGALEAPRAHLLQDVDGHLGLRAQTPYLRTDAQQVHVISQYSPHLSKAMVGLDARTCTAPYVLAEAVLCIIL